MAKTIKTNPKHKEQIKVTQTAVPPTMVKFTCRLVRDDLYKAGSKLKNFKLFKTLSWVDKVTVSVHIRHQNVLKTRRRHISPQARVSVMFLPRLNRYLMSSVICY